MAKKDDNDQVPPSPPPIQEEFVIRVRARMGELFDAAVIVVPWFTENGDQTIRVIGVGHPSFWRGMLNDAYEFTFNKDE